MKRSIVISAILIGSLSVVLCAVIFLGEIIEFSINHFTDYRVSYSELDLVSIGTGRFSDIAVTLPEKDLTVNADSIEYWISAERVIKNKKVEGYCRMAGVSFFFWDEDRVQKKSPENLFFMPFDRNRKYEEIFFYFSLGEDSVKIHDFKADSADIRISGEYEYCGSKDEVKVYIILSFSPEMTVAFGESVRDNVLSPDEGGWYSTVIDYKGNPAFLLALYELTAK